ncbi:hypothetical protein ABT023_15845 [Micromonospora sp. NPDC002296]|uniref:hypothetical protein n=1 Tax=Micromonospora sp. NPDC002296 TaxID=3154271 RepID=UPI00331F6A01
MRRLVITRIVMPLFEDHERVWPDEDEVFPERVRLRVLDVVDDVQGQLLGRPAMVALKDSANTKGVPVSGAPVPVDALTGEGEGTATAAGAEEASDGTASDAEDLDVYALVARRKEQRRLRRMKFGDRALIPCDLCGRETPRHLVVLAHIKRRADSSYEERLNPSNVMAACLLGCDALFEHGHVYVDADGRIRPGRAAGQSVAAKVEGLNGRDCPAFDPVSAPFFAAHTARTFAIDQGSAWSVDYEMGSDHGAHKGRVFGQPGRTGATWDR